MRLLILTQKIDIHDPVLGFFHRWVEEFAKHCEQITVIALGVVGEYHLPNNVRVFSLGKERGVSRLKYVSNFYHLIWRERKNYDAVFVHMNPEYVVLGGIVWRLWGKRISLWYTHKSVDLKLRVAEKFAHRIFTASDESLRLITPKKRVMGHGIDVNFFRPGEHPASSKRFEILTIGRISPVKDYGTLITAAGKLLHKGKDVHVTIVGGPGTPEQERYHTELQRLADTYIKSGQMSFVGPVSHSETLRYLQNAQVFVSMSQTGSLDKAILEAMSTGLPVLSCNDAARGMFGSKYDELLFCAGDAEDLAQKCEQLITMTDRERGALGKQMREIVVKDHNLASLIKNITHDLSW